jgi:hypothetical protein
VEEAFLSLAKDIKVKIDKKAVRLFESSDCNETSFCLIREPIRVGITWFRLVFDRNKTRISRVARFGRVVRYSKKKLK